MSKQLKNLLRLKKLFQKIERIMPPIEDVSETKKKFAGYKFYKNSGKSFCCTISIHRFVWTYFNGEIPEGYDIHHLDLNHDNNDIANLELVTKNEHKKIHMSIKICEVCGKKFSTIEGAKFCSRKFFYEYR